MSDPLAFLRAVHARAEMTVKALREVTESTHRDGTDSWHMAGKPLRHFLDICGPEATLRRIAADRKMLALHGTPHTVVDGFCVEEGGECTHKGEAECPICGQEPCDTVRLIAEGYGWTETEQR